MSHPNVAFLATFEPALSELEGVGILTFNPSYQTAPTRSLNEAHLGLMRTGPPTGPELLK